MEINEYRKQVTQLEMELESLRGTNDYLERNLAGKFICFCYFNFSILKMLKNVRKLKSTLISSESIDFKRSSTDQRTT